MSKNGYNSYRGRRSAGRGLLIAVLVLILAGACTVLFLQQYITYTDDGGIHLDLPFFRQEGVPPPAGGEEAAPPADMNLVVEESTPAEPEPEPYGQRRLLELTDLPADETALRAVLAEAGANGFVWTARDNTGRVFYDSSAAIASAAVGAAGTAEALGGLCGAEDIVSVARLNCFHDSYYAWVNMESAGVCQSSGYIWYDNFSYHWLDPAKEQARSYVIGLALECAQLGFDELLLEEVCYPYRGNLYKIDYSKNSMGKVQALELFVTELRRALEGYDIKLTLLADPRLLSEGERASYIAEAGMEPGTLLPLFDAVYVPTEDAAAASAALTQAAGGSALPPLIPVTAAPPAEGSWLRLPR